jgi:hypothetical protein
MTTKMVRNLNCRATHISATTTTSLIAAILFSTILGVSRDAQCDPDSGAILDRYSFNDTFLAANEPSYTRPDGKADKKPGTPSGNVSHNTPLKQDEDKEEKKENKFDTPLEEYTDWKGQGGDKFYGKGDYLTSKVEGQEMLFHSNDGGKTYYPVKNGSYQIADGKVSLQQGFNPSAPGAVEGRVSSGGGAIANGMDSLQPDPAVRGSTGGGHWEFRETVCSLAGKCGPQKVWVRH